jgi:hypothetical protein
MITYQKSRTHEKFELYIRRNHSNAEIDFAVNSHNTSAISSLYAFRLNASTMHIPSPKKVNVYAIPTAAMKNKKASLQPASLTPLDSKREWLAHTPTFKHCFFSSREAGIPFQGTSSLKPATRGHCQ